MVQNVGGGNKSKGLARKFVVQAQNQGGGGKTVRTVKESGEQYAIVQKHLGNCMCMVFCSDGYRRLCIIRKKFTGRRKTDNNISSGSVVMVGLQDYSGGDSGGSDAGKSAGGVKRCDLLYVYSEQEKEKLRKVCDLSKLSASLDDQPKYGQPKPGLGLGLGLGQERSFESEEVAFVTSGTGAFNKYAKDDARGRGTAGSGAALLGDGGKSSGSSSSSKSNKNVISSADWLDDMPPLEESDDGEEEEEEGDDGERVKGVKGAGSNISEDESDESDESDEPEPEPEPVYNKSNSNPKPKPGAVINIDDI